MFHLTGVPAMSVVVVILLSSSVVLNQIRQFFSCASIAFCARCSRFSLNFYYKIHKKQIFFGNSAEEMLFFLATKNYKGRL